MNTLALTYEEPHPYQDRVRTRCVECGKVVVGYDEATARLRAEQITNRGGVSPRYDCVMRAYKGRCGHWHVSRDKQARRLS